MLRGCDGMYRLLRRRYELGIEDCPLHVWRNVLRFLERVAWRAMGDVFITVGTK